MAGTNNLNTRCAPAPEDSFPVLQIRVDFDIPAYISQEHQERLLNLIHAVVAADYNQPVDGVFWPAGIGSLPQWNKADSVFLGKPVGANAPEGGEPTFDDSVFHIECCARPFVTEEERNRHRARRALPPAPPVSPGPSESE